MAATSLVRQHIETVGKKIRSFPQFVVVVRPGRWFRRGLPYLATAVILTFLLRQIEISDLWRLLLGVKGEWLAVGLGWYLLTLVLRAYRFGGLLQLNGPWQPLRLLPEVVALSFFNNVLPARAGELSFPVLLQRRQGVPVGEGTAVLLLARLFDFLTVTFLYITFTFWQYGPAFALFRSLPAAAADSSVVMGEQPVVWHLALLLLPALLLLAALPWLGEGLLSLLTRWGDRVGLAENSTGHRLLSSGRHLVTTMRGRHRLGVYGRTFFWSVLGWLSTFAWFTAFLYALDLPLSYPSVVVGATFATLAKAIPFVTVGGFGAHDAGWAFGFHLVGMPLETAIASGLAVNLLTLLVSLVMAVWAVLIHGIHHQLGH